MKTLILIIAVIVCISCSSPKKAVYYKQSYREESRRHLHGKIHSPHFLPIRDDNNSHNIVDNYRLLYGEKHQETYQHKQKEAFSWVLQYLFAIFMLNLPSFL